jgi:hypothetical protein
VHDTLRVSILDRWHGELEGSNGHCNAGSATLADEVVKILKR